MSMKKEDYEEFQRQLALQNVQQFSAGVKDVKTKIDEDGTEYEWDGEKKAWFPKISVDLMLSYQSGYTNTNENEDKNKSSSTATYLDPQTKIKYIWDESTENWKPEPVHSSFLNPCTYTDPTTGHVYIWDSKKQQWKLENPVAQVSATKSDSEKSDSVKEICSGKGSVDALTPNLIDPSMASNKSTNIYVHPESGDVYTWNNVKQAWMTDDGKILYPTTKWINSQTYKDEQTGKLYVWSEESHTWKESGDGKRTSAQEKKTKARPNKRSATKPEWFDAAREKNTNVYISGLPLDISHAEFVELMSKCGIIAPNPSTGEHKLKLYTDNKGNLKGDGLCCYLKKESIALAIQLLDGTKIRGYTLSVQEAQFQMKGTYDASKKPKMLSKKEKKKFQKDQEKLLDWKLARAEEAVSKTDRVVILKNMFDTKEFEEDPVQITEIRDDLRKECENFGQVKKVIIFDRHPDGVCSVAFKDPEDAKKCQQALNGRWFAYRTVEANIWDGVTNYQIEETDKERELRLKKWDEFLCEDVTKSKDDTADSNQPTPACLPENSDEMGKEKPTEEAA